MISRHYQTDSQGLTEALIEIQSRTLNRIRKRFVDQVLVETLHRLIDRHPVETGRARNAWQTAQTQLQHGAVADDSTEGGSRFQEDRHVSTAEATNRVNYVMFLEEGTREMRPRHLVAKSLAEVILRIEQIAVPIVREELQTP
ncbi:MAG: hypothetical protein HUJ26_08180 [Planctomycetaceae bacterium]|nr:hypothetical protein [Planctomycetaceae bacterium]